MNVVEILGVAASALQAIRALTSSPVADDGAKLAMAIGEIYVAMEKAGAGHITPDVAKAEIAKLVATLATNDDAADAALAKRFTP